MPIQTTVFGFRIGEPVHIDSDKSITATVTGLMAEGEDGKHRSIRIAWVHNGDTKEVWIQEWRLERAAS